MKKILGLWAFSMFFPVISHAALVNWVEGVDGDLAGQIFTFDTAGVNTFTGNASWAQQVTPDNDFFNIDLASGYKLVSIGFTETATSATASSGTVGFYLNMANYEPVSIPSTDSGTHFDSILPEIGPGTYLTGYTSPGIGQPTEGYSYSLDYTLTYTVAAVPVPAAVWLFGSGLLGLVGIARRKKTA